MAEARITYHKQLDQQQDAVLAMVGPVVESLNRVVDAVVRQDTELAESVVRDDDRVDHAYLEAHSGILNLLALQAPVAIDLRLITALLQVSANLERVGDLCVNIAKLVPLAGHLPPVDDQVIESIKEMGAQCVLQLNQAKQAFADRNVELAEGLTIEDDRIDDLNRNIFRRALEIGGQSPNVREWATHMMFVARYLERIGDHTVDIGEQAAFVVTGEFREFTDASRPDSLAI